MDKSDRDAWIGALGAFILALAAIFVLQWYWIVLTLVAAGAAYLVFSSSRSKQLLMTGLAVLFVFYLYLWWEGSETWAFLLIFIILMVLSIIMLYRTDEDRRHEGKWHHWLTVFLAVFALFVVLWGLVLVFGFLVLGEDWRQARWTVWSVFCVIAGFYVGGLTSDRYTGYSMAMLVFWWLTAVLTVFRLEDFIPTY